MASILGIYRNVDDETLLKRQSEVLSALSKSNGRTSHSWTDGNVSMSENFSYTSLQKELAEINYELHRRGLDRDTESGISSKIPGVFVPPGTRALF